MSETDGNTGGNTDGKSGGDNAGDGSRVLSGNRYMRAWEEIKQEANEDGPDKATLSIISKLDPDLRKEAEDALMGGRGSFVLEAVKAGAFTNEQMYDYFTRYGISKLDRDILDQMAEHAEKKAEAHGIIDDEARTPQSAEKEWAEFLTRIREYNTQIDVLEPADVSGGSSSSSSSSKRDSSNPYAASYEALDVPDEYRAYTNTKFGDSPLDRVVTTHIPRDEARFAAGREIIEQRLAYEEMSSEQKIDVAHTYGHATLGEYQAMDQKDRIHGLKVMDNTATDGMIDTATEMGRMAEQAANDPRLGATPEERKTNFNRGVMVMLEERTRLEQEEAQSGKLQKS